MWIHLWFGLYLIFLMLMLNGKMAAAIFDWYKDSGMESFVLPGRMKDPVFLRRVYRVIGTVSIPVAALGYFIALSR